MGTRHLVAGALCAVLLLGGCAQGGTTAPGAPGGSSMPPTSPSPEPLPSGLSLPPSPSGSAKAGSMTLTGTVEAGVEAGCLLLRSGGTTYLLIGGDRTVVKAGATVRVTGAVARDIKSYCMQGTPFQVTAAAPA
jgi:hypothetical protein